jgi:hypothetical protein
LGEYAENVVDLEARCYVRLDCLIQSRRDRIRTRILSSFPIVTRIGERGCGGAGFGESGGDSWNPRSNIVDILSSDEGFRICPGSTLNIGDLGLGRLSSNPS